MADGRAKLDEALDADEKSIAEVERLADGLAPRFIVAVGCIPGIAVGELPISRACHPDRL